MVFKHRGYSFVKSRVKYDAMAYRYLEGLSLDSKERYKTKLQISKLIESPYIVPEGAWSSDLTKWPNVDYPDIYDYLINSPG